MAALVLKLFTMFQKVSLFFDKENEESLSF